MPKKIVSIAFFRNRHSEYESARCGEAQGKFFVNYLATFVRAHHSVFGDWKLMVHHDDRAKAFPYFGTLVRMQSRGLLVLQDCGTADTLCGSMLWRLRPVWDPAVEVVICRDLDSLPTPREKRAVDRWIADDSCWLHSMQDSPSHRSTTLMGGMVGFKAKHAKLYNSFDSFMGAVSYIGINLNQKGADQKVLAMMYGRYSQYLRLDTPDTLGAHDDPRDRCDGHARHIGGAFHCEPVRVFYDKNGYTDPRIPECERG